MDKVEKHGVISEIIYHNDENGYSVIVVENDEESFTAVGYLPASYRGRSFLFKGNYKAHPNYGEQFVIEWMEEEMPQTSEGLISFLASGVVKGVGPKTARLLVTKFGEKTLEVIESQPKELEKVEGIGKKKALQIAESYKVHKDFAEVTIFFQQFGISSAYAMKLYKIYGKDTVKEVKQNPYRMVDEVFGINFKKADMIAAKMGLEAESTQRILCAVKYWLNRYLNEGHTFAPQKLFCEELAQAIEVSLERIDEVLSAMVFDDDIHIENLEDRPVIFLLPYFHAEQNVCKQLMTLENSSLKHINSDVDNLISVNEKEMGVTLSENQKYAVKACLQRGVSVITGGPGTGKTTIINTIMKILTHSGLKTAIAAPTGRAAKRITETSGYEASTIHRLLEYYYSEGEDTMRFGKDRENPLDFDVVIVDEASMIDILLMNGLLNAIVPGTRLIIVGDADQLPSVGAGNVLRDIIASEVIYSVKLTEIFRQAKESLIVVNAHKINKGEYPSFNEKEKDFFFLRRQGQMELLETIKELVLKRLPAFYSDCDPVKDVQVLTPVRKGHLGMLNLNNQLQSILNPPRDGLDEKVFGNRTFRVGDKVMQIKNNYMLEWKKSDDFTTGQGVFNGDVGFIHSIDLEFNQLTVVFEETKFVIYEFMALDELELAYAVTVHKSQGSEFPIIIMPVTWFPEKLATRNLLYTAVTRGKKAVVLVGSEDKMQGMIDNNLTTERYSGLRVRLANFIGFLS